MRRIDEGCPMNGSDATGGQHAGRVRGRSCRCRVLGRRSQRRRFRDVNLTDAKISHAWLVNVDIDALVDTVVINGVDVTAYVNERDPWYPLRAMLRPTTPEGMRATWAALEAEWAKTIARAQRAPRGHAARVGQRRVVLRPDAAPSRHGDGQVVHRADPRRELPPDRVAEQRLRRLPVARPRLRPDAVARRRRWPCARIAPRAFATISRSVTPTDFDATDRRARERHEPVAGMPLHRLRGRVLAQPLREARPAERPVPISGLAGLRSAWAAPCGRRRRCRGRRCRRSGLPCPC